MSTDGCLGILLNEFMQDPFDIDIDKIRLLIRWGADPNTRSKDGHTCLHLALQSFPLHFVPKPEDDFTTKSWWRKPKDDFIIVLILLMNAGADIHAKDNDGFEPSDYASDLESILKREYIWDYWRAYWRQNWSHEGDMQLMTLWKKALSESGYDAEEVMSRTSRAQELSDNPNEEYEELFDGVDERAEDNLKESTLLNEKGTDQNLSSSTVSSRPVEYLGSLFDESTNPEPRFDQSMGDDCGSSTSANPQEPSLWLDQISPSILNDDTVSTATDLNTAAQRPFIPESNYPIDAVASSNSLYGSDNQMYQSPFSNDYDQNWSY